MARIKGIAIIDLVRFLGKNKGKFYPLLEPAEKEWLSQRILLGNWCDDRPYVKCMRLLDQEFGAGDLAYA